MSTHAGPGHTPPAGECRWSHLFSGATLWCDEQAIPGDPWLCTKHLVQAVHEADLRAELAHWTATRRAS